MSTLVKRRAEIIEHGGAEKKHGAAGGGVDSTMLEMERQHKAKILEATKRRMYEEQQRNLAEEAKKEQMIEDERKMDAVLAKRREERDETFQERREAAERERLRRDRLQREQVRTYDCVLTAPSFYATAQQLMHVCWQERMAELRARAVEQQREKQERKIAAELEARKLKMRERGLHFAEVQAQKIEEIAAMNASKEESRQESAAESRVEALQRQAEPEHRMEVRKEGIMEANRAKSQANERKRQRRKRRDAEKLDRSRRAILAKLERVDSRLAEREEEEEAARKERKRVDAYKERERRRKLDIINRSYSESAGSTVGKMEEKERAMEKAARRRVAALELRAEDSRLKFAAKRENIERQQRVQEHQHYLATVAQEEKDARLDALVAGQQVRKHHRSQAAILAGLRRSH